jgi:hypothetical protein
MRTQADGAPGGPAAAIQRPLPGPGLFQWNTGAWFGGQLGGTGWLLPGAAVLAPQAPALAAVWLLCFAAPNALGVWLWRRRDRVRPHPALQALVLVITLSGLVAVAALDVAGPPGVRLELVWEGGGPRLTELPPGAMCGAYLFFAGVPGVMGLWYCLERGAVRERSRAAGRA